MTRHHHNFETGHHQIFEIKAAFRELVKLAGGQEYVARLTGMPQSKISEAGSVNHEDRAPRVDHVAALEAETGRPLITKLLADFAGLELAPAGSFKIGDPHLHLAIIKESGDVTAAISQALADGQISPSEARSLKRQADEAIDALQSFVAQMNGIKRDFS